MLDNNQSSKIKFLSWRLRCVVHLSAVLTNIWVVDILLSSRLIMLVSLNVAKDILFVLFIGSYREQPITFKHVFRTDKTYKLLLLPVDLFVFLLVFVLDGHNSFVLVQVIVEILRRELIEKVAMVVFLQSLLAI